MQVVGAGAGAGAGDGDVGAIPSAIWDGPTARIIERRNYARRHDRRSAPDAATPQPGPARQKKNMIIGISLLAFASGLALATAANRLPRSTADRIAQLELRHPATPTRAPQPPTAGAAAEMIIQPLATAAVQPPPTPAAVSAPIDEPRPAAQP